MHECWTCGTVCDCDGDDTWGLEPEDHSCINPECREGPGYDPVDDDDDDLATLDTMSPAAAPGIPTADDVLAVASVVLRLGEVERVPTHPDGVRHETDTTHSVMLALVAAQTASRLGLDPGTAALYALLHDLPEAYSGDVDTSRGLNAEQRAAKQQAETAAMCRIIGQLGGGGVTVEALFDYEDRKLPEARLVALLDKAMPKAVRVVSGDLRQSPGSEVAALETAATSQAARLRAEFPEPELRPVHELADQLRLMLFDGGRP